MHGRYLTANAYEVSVEFMIGKSDHGDRQRKVMKVVIMVMLSINVNITQSQTATNSRKDSTLQAYLDRYTTA